MRSGVRLSLLMGPVVPIPVPRGVVDALQSVQVRSAAGDRSGFQLTFALDAKSTLNTLLLLLPQIGPVIRCVLIATTGATPTVLMDGVVTHHQVSADVETGRSVLSVTGEDLTRVMDLIDFSGFPYPAMPAEARVALIVAKYAMFGMIPLVIPSVTIDVPIPTDRIPTHHGTDLQYVTQLAQEVGYVFYVEPGPVPGVNKAYWGPEIKVGVPQRALNVNMDAFTNVQSLQFSFDGTQKTMPIVYIQIKESKTTIPIPIPDISPLNPPLGLIPPLNVRFAPMDETAKLSPAQAIMLGLAEAARTADAVTGQGKLDVVRYGGILRSRSLVGVRGAGQAFDGLYYVKSVTHEIKRGEYTQSFTLARNGLISTVPKVPA
jgi:hypothetical protein